ncbi:sigma-54-dependent transcriptional regulator [Labrys wisconsinensis]|uniref:DNA-binding transcriptional regulator NtrC n=1 Tax=Labrys wisconsinensis TaxID=425677 RepID=A0ABU0J114_9HYPH|nr:sigma-54 dependent transcriptional regulator [Labrys wisconsinensis]MDQ0467943.1 DNA-binding NtrC family response regulator [Labrys wisconsinensis]
MTATILIADDDPVQRRLLEATLRRFGYEVSLVEGGEAALRALESHDFDVMILDLVMPDLDGMGVLERMRDKGLETPVIVQTAHGSIDAVISAMRAGAADFVVKPVGAERLQVSIRNAMKSRALEGEVRLLSRRAAGTLGFRDLVSRSPEMERVIRLGERAAASGIPVLIEGESGVGKEVVARAIQGASERRGKAFIAVNCGALPANLAESILFGHEKGAFTGASERHVGKFAEANGGTLFLDEVGELTPDIQVKLLRALQEGEVDPVGAKRPVKIDFRLISATNKNLIELVKEGKFREDLYYRLHVFPVMLPPLRARREDVPDLARHFMARFAAEEGRKIRSITAEALALLVAYDWPGNVRQLENTLFRAVVLADGDELGVAEFPQIAALVEGFDVRIPAAPVLPPKPVHAGPAMITGQPLREVVTVRDPHTLPLLDGRGDVRSMEAIETETLKFAIRHYRGQMTEVARKLGIGRSTLYRKLKELGLEASVPQGCGLEDTSAGEAAA